MWSSSDNGGAIPAVPAIAVPVSGYDSNGAVMASGSRSAGAKFVSKMADFFYCNLIFVFISLT